MANQNKPSPKEEKHKEELENPAPSPEVGPEELEQTAAELTELQKRAAESDSLKDQLLRLRAEFDNYRKDSRKEREAAREAAVASFASDLFFAIDDLERVLAHLDPKDKGGPLAKGVELVHSKLLQILADRSIRPIQIEGKLYDPAYHEAIATEATDRVPPNTILDEARRGYTMNGRVIRAAQVRVATRPAPAGEPSPGE